MRWKCPKKAKVNKRLRDGVSLLSAVVTASLNDDFSGGGVMPSDDRSFYEGSLVGLIDAPLVALERG